MYTGWHPLISSKKASGESEKDTLLMIRPTWKWTQVCASWFPVPSFLPVQTKTQPWSTQTSIGSAFFYIYTYFLKARVLWMPGINIARNASFFQSIFWGFCAFFYLIGQLEVWQEMGERERGNDTQQMAIGPNRTRGCSSEDIVSVRGMPVLPTELRSAPHVMHFNT